MDKFLNADLQESLSDTPFPIERRADFIEFTKDEVFEGVGSDQF
nr:hypothetical protein [Candidatus Freyarchaeota archaeon]